MEKNILYSLFSVILVSYLTTCLKVVPERPVVDYLNPKYLTDGHLDVVRYGRRSDYYMNIIGTIRTEWNNNVTIHLVFYEHLNNQYKRSFVEMRNKFCDLVNDDPLVGKMLLLTGTVPCPAPAGSYRIMNMTVPSEKMPYVWPFEKCRVDIRLSQTQSNETIASGYIFLTLKKERKKVK